MNTTLEAGAMGQLIMFEHGRKIRLSFIGVNFVVTVVVWFLFGDLYCSYVGVEASLLAQMVKNLPAVQETWV